MVWRNGTSSEGCRVGVVSPADQDLDTEDSQGQVTKVAVSVLTQGFERPSAWAARIIALADRPPPIPVSPPSAFSDRII